MQRRWIEDGARTAAAAAAHLPPRYLARPGVGPLVPALALLVLSAGSPAAAAGLSAQIGATTNYIFRGVEQTGKPNPYVGLDGELSGIYAGTWITAVDPGLEVDLYAGYGRSFGPWELSAGYTGYLYTDDDFDDNYHELNLYTSFATTDRASVDLEQTFGVHDTDPEQRDYSFTRIAVNWVGFSAAYGSFNADIEGSYLEFAYTTDFRGVEIGVHLVASDQNLAGGESEEYLYFDISKSFDL